ncbi:MAG: heavy metal-binding domain-containing protein [Chthoniobacterales bacterium]
MKPGFFGHSSILTLLGALLFAGCATNFEPPPFTADHPASPQAAEVRRSRPPRLAADGLTRKTIAQLERKDAPDPDYHPTDGSMQHDMGSMEGMGDAKASRPAPSAAQTKAYWTCVMHPEIHADKPGQCPKCGMTLIKKEGAP